MRRIRSPSTTAASCSRLAASYLTIIMNQTQSYLSSQKCVMAAPATAWRQHIDDTGQIHAACVPQRVRGCKTIRDMGLRVLRPFWLHLLISPAGGRFKAATHPCRAIVADRIRSTLWHISPSHISSLWIFLHSCNSSFPLYTSFGCFVWPIESFRGVVIAMESRQYISTSPCRCLLSATKRRNPGFVLDAPTCPFVQ
ncbi:hypothetical protein BKA58DRAFT_83448 [Alternaria rosae]|uniref:uncharacterized protein n=1 Tax=Alternaria rosae TaxID=1187941 RepID=UPI001E8CA6CB|nr:uncharacterized protein BKA58DRAFT_83448 [Alternaria rosae]KAH6877826.1 hypothetical protein BKA58DRAFT_83448 [Alternaria rosae]